MNNLQNNLRVEILDVKGSWREVADAARVTVGLPPGEGRPSSKWIKQMLLAEHSPIRKIIVSWRWYELPYWVSVHFTRHKIGIEHWVKAQRSDRTNVDRNNLPQNAPIIHECTANAQALINISRKRLCSRAAKETRQAWKMFLDKLKEYEPELVSVCVPECVYRGFCPELKSCGFIMTEDYKVMRLNYKSVSESY